MNTHTSTNTNTIILALHPAGSPAAARPVRAHPAGPPAAARSRLLGWPPVAGKSMMQYEAIWCNNLFSMSIFNFLLVRPWENHMPSVQCLLFVH